MQDKIVEAVQAAIKTIFVLVILQLGFWIGYDYNEYRAWIYYSKELLRIQTQFNDFLEPLSTRCLDTGTKLWRCENHVK